MSKISTVIDTIRTAIPALSGFSSKTEIPNPYSLVDNNSNLLKDGWGLAVGSATADFNEFCKFFEEREFSIILTRQVFSLANCADQPVTAAKSLLEDMILIKKDLLNIDQLGIPTSIARINLGSSSGIESVNGDKFNYFTISTSFLITISEDIE